MDSRRIIFTSFLLVVLGFGVNGFPMNELITKLPGQPDVTFRQFAGYVDVDENVDGRSMFYYFVEAEKDPLSQPLTIWLTGGPGCSAVGDGFTSVGPFFTTKNARGLRASLYAWNKVSNLLFIDSPIGAGWSYSNISTDYYNDDASTNKILLSFVQKWYEKYPELKSNDLYIAGSSYAGHFIPNLANALLDHNDQSESKFNLRGLILGNPLLRQKLDYQSRAELFFSRGMINNTVYDEVKRECNAINEDSYPSNIFTNWTARCAQLVEAVPAIAFKTNVDASKKAHLFDIYRGDDPCGAADWEALIMGKEVSRFDFGVDMCRPFRAQFYFNLPEVQKAFHGNRTNLSYQWAGCNSTMFKFNTSNRHLDMLPALKKLNQRALPITIFSGNQDAIVPADGTIQHLRKLAQELNITSIKEEAWSFENEEKGRKYTFGDMLTLYTVNGGNHHVTASRPSEALYLFTDFTAYKKHVLDTSVSKN